MQLLLCCHLGVLTCFDVRLWYLKDPAEVPSSPLPSPMAQHTLCSKTSCLLLLPNFS